MSPRTRATIDDLYRVPENGKAELVSGEIVLMAPTGGVPGRAGGEIYVSLREYERRTGRGYAFPDNGGFVVDLPHRGSFSPDAAFHPGPPAGRTIPGWLPYLRRGGAQRDGLRGEGRARNGGEAGRLFRRGHPGGVGRRRPARARGTCLPRRPPGSADDLSERQSSRSRAGLARMVHAGR